MHLGARHTSTRPLANIEWANANLTMCLLPTQCGVFFFHVRPSTNRDEFRHVCGFHVALASNARLPPRLPSRNDTRHTSSGRDTRHPCGRETRRYAAPISKGYAAHVIWARSTAPLKPQRPANTHPGAASEAQERVAGSGTGAAKERLKRRQTP